MSYIANINLIYILYMRYYISNICAIIIAIFIYIYNHMMNNNNIDK